MKKTMLPLLIAPMLVAGCGSSEPPPGPNVVGYSLPEARVALEEANIAYTEHATDALLGVLVPENFVVCEVVKVNERMVRLEVAKRGC